MKERGKARPGVKSQANSYTKVWVSINDSQSINQSKLLEQWSRRRRRLGSEWTRNEAQAEAEGSRIQWNFLHAFLLYFCCAASSSSSSSFSSYSSVWLVSALICALPANDCSCLLHLDSQFKRENEGREKNKQGSNNRESSNVMYPILVWTKPFNKYLFCVAYFSGHLEFHYYFYFLYNFYAYHPILTK